MTSALLVVAACSAAATNVVEYDFNAMLQPVPPTAKWADTSYNIWCGSAVKGDDGKVHLFYSRWPRKLGHLAWVTHSEVAHAVSDSPFGPWQHRDVTLPARGTNFWDGSCTHNPTVLRIGRTFYLYYMGNYGDGVLGKSLNWTHRNHQRIGVAVADSPNGPWTRFDRPVVDISSDTNAPDALVVTNPSVTERAGGGVLMIYKAVGLKRALPFGGPVVHLVATADSPLGPFTKRPGEVFGAKGVMFAAEDPFIWRGADRYWAIVKDNDGHFTKRGYSLALWETADGFDWKLSEHPFVANRSTIRWADGSEAKLHSLERPQLIFDNGVPSALLCAAADARDRDGSFNLQIPLKLPGFPSPQPLLPGDTNQWESVWRDEFDGPDATLDLKWQAQNGPSTHILSSRWRENVVITNGILRLAARKEKRGGQEWTAGSIWTRETFQYGYFECRYRYAGAEGLNNSFWLMPKSTNQVTAGKLFEIDVNEGHYPNKVSSNIHNHSDVAVVNGKRTHATASKTFTYPEKDFACDFQVHGLEWNEHELIFYLNGKVIRRVKNEFCLSPAPVWLSLAVIPWAGRITDAIDGTAMEVDYVRVYRRKP